jgi:hypothetical protein
MHPDLKSDILLILSKCESLLLNAINEMHSELSAENKEEFKNMIKGFVKINNNYFREQLDIYDNDLIEKMSASFEKSLDKKTIIQL